MNSAEIAIQDSTTHQKTSAWKDYIGIVASIGCAIHCAAMPLPAWGLSFLADEAFHKWMALACFLIAIAAFLPGLRRHGSWLPIGIGSVGLAVITFAAFGLAGECCPSCAAANSTVAQTESTGCAACGDECEYCAGSESEKEKAPANNTLAVAHETEIAKPESADWLSTLAPWLTPFGGLLLVSAHLVNRSCGSCSCCEPAEPV